MKQLNIKSKKPTVSRNKVNADEFRVICLHPCKELSTTMNTPAIDYKDSTNTIR